MQVRSLGQEDPLEKKMATHSSILAWEVPWTEWCEEPTHWERPLMLGMTKGRRRRGWQRIRCLDSITDAMDLSLSRLWELVMDRDACMLHPCGQKELDMNERLNWTKLNWVLYRRGTYSIKQSSPTAWAGTGPWPVKSQAAQQEVRGAQASKTSSVFTAAPHHSRYCLISASCQSQSSSGIRSANYCAWIFLKPSIHSKSVENCPPWSRSLMPKRLWTAGTKGGE